ncbi:Cdc6/Cdc18 family protein [Halobiforma nitratireducens]|uniref:Cdc6-related protein AAA superfamily ATPase-like protein n=1 Tax=Halobiforma nitratireducens JCM 10879 TaxID=1227454 RepID=M0LPA7_9EURY|nr:AAA family ATPase [Halobiforma nitratireducens]EMA35331.1 Cdc6-related protein AAA superfamily ATPase- like protein [Halobiforma nitratireducens JCM 10879]
MNLRDRIDRRHNAHGDRQLAVDRDLLAPTVHRSEPVGRGPALEQLLDALEPVFDGDLPPPLAVIGPHGAGTSALVVALFDALNDRFGGAGGAVGTTTRARPSEPTAWFVHVDGRRVDSEFSFYRSVLDVLSPEPVPESGIGTDDLQARVQDRLAGNRQAVVAIDHHDEPETLDYGRVRDLLKVADVTDSIATVAVGRHKPDDWGGATVSLPAYRSHELVDIVTDRASSGLVAGGFDHESIRTLAEWADGNAHDALAALFVATTVAEREDADRITERHLEYGRMDVHENGVHVDRALALSETRQQALAHLVSLDLDVTTTPIGDLANAVAERSSLTTGTVKRFLYELAERGVLERIELEADGTGRNPSALDPLIPPAAFRELAAVSFDANGPTELPVNHDTDADARLEARPDREPDSGS